MLFQGFERLGNQDDPALPIEKQEWAVQVAVEPHGIPQTSTPLGVDPPRRGHTVSKLSSDR